jgi:hypothetical protein
MHPINAVAVEAVLQASGCLSFSTAQRRRMSLGNIGVQNPCFSSAVRLLANAGHSKQSIWIVVNGWRCPVPTPYFGQSLNPGVSIRIEPFLYSSSCEPPV